MNAFNMAPHGLEHSQDIASIDLGRLLTSSLPRTRLLPLVAEKVKLAVAQFVERAPVSVSASADDAKGSAKAADYLRRALAIPLQPELCTLMARVGFDISLLTYGNAAGVPVGYVDGMWLLKFVESAVSEPTRYQDASWLEFPGTDRQRRAA